MFVGKTNRVMNMSTTREKSELVNTIPPNTRFMVTTMFWRVGMMLSMAVMCCCSRVGREGRVDETCNAGGRGRASGRTAGDSNIDTTMVA